MPSNIVWFERLMYASLAIGLVISVLVFDWLSALTSPGNVITTQAFIFALNVFFIWLIARRRKNWARWVFLIMWVLGAILGVPVQVQTFRVNTAAGVLSLSQVLLQLAALYLVFTGNAREWFKAQT